MIRALIVVAFVFLVAAGFAWLAERPGNLALTWQGYEIRTSLMVAAIVIALVIAAIAAVGALIRAIVATPQSVGHFLGARRRDRGYRALTRGMIAVGAGDVRAARRAAQESKALLGAEPLVLLLSAQAAQIAGDAPAARTAFEALSAEHDTQVLGLHGLFIEARRQGEHAAARHFAEEATRLQPRVGWAGTALFEYQSRSGDWQGALATLAVNAGNGVVDRARAKRLRAVLTTAQAMSLEAGEPDEARALAAEAHKLAPDLVPAATAAARLFTRHGDIRRATRILEATWKLSPHPEIAEAYADVRPGDSVRDRLKRVRRLADLRANHPEGAMAVARAAIDAHDWQAARNALGGAMRANPSERVCLLMAEIEEGENGDQGRVRVWLTRALSAPRDPSWTADGHVFDQWAPVSPVSGRIDAFEWRVAVDRLPALRYDVEIGSDTGEGETATAVDEPGAPAAPLALGAPPTLVRPAAAEARTGPRPPIPGTQPAAGPRPMARAPDDPGPPRRDEDEETGGLSAFRPGRTA
jgi:HemY protein